MTQTNTMEHRISSLKWQSDDLNVTYYMHITNRSPQSSYTHAILNQQLS